jgi:hypothetical protein
MTEISQYFANIDANNLVLSVHVVSAEYMAENPDRYAGTWVETFINVPGKTYAGVGYTYDKQTKDFIAPPSPLVPGE